VLAIGTATGLIAQKLKIPDVAMFLLVGMGIGPDTLNLVNIRADSALNQLILIFGSCYILFDGGASLRFKVLKEVWVTIVVIATLGVLHHGANHRHRRPLHPRIPLIVALLPGRGSGFHRPGDPGAHSSSR